MNLLAKLKNRHWILVGIFCLALFLRLYKLGNMPLHLHQDELMNGYVGRFILQNGIDLYGNRWPLLYFNNFGDYPNVIPMYISGFSTYIFGVNEFAIRFPIAVAGALAIFPMYFLCKRAFLDERTALFATVGLAILPWHVVLSRSTAEVVSAGTVFLFGLSLLLYGIQKKTYTPLIISLGLLLSTYVLYASFRVMVPLVLIAAALLTTKRKLQFVIVTFALVALALTGLVSSTVWGKARFKQTAVFYFNNTVQDRINSFAASAGRENVPVVRIFNNKLIVYTREIVRQYLSYYSPNFLFTDGGRPYRYFVPDQGLLYLGFLGLFLASLVLPLVGNGQKITPINRSLLLFFLFTLAVSPLSSALTLDEVPNVHRSGFTGVMLLFVFGYCFRQLNAVRFRRFPVTVFFSLFIALEFIFFLNQYFIQGPMAQARGRYDERTDLIHYIIGDKDQYDKVFVTREVFPLYYLFYTKNFDPKLAGQFQQNLIIPTVDNVHFVDTDCPTQKKKEELAITPKSLVIDRAHCIDPLGFSTIDVISNTDGTRAYTVYKPSKQ